MNLKVKNTQKRDLFHFFLVDRMRGDNDLTNYQFADCTDRQTQFPVGIIHNWFVRPLFLSVR